MREGEGDLNSIHFYQEPILLWNKVTQLHCTSLQLSIALTLFSTFTRDTSEGTAHPLILTSFMTGTDHQGLPQNASPHSHWDAKVLWVSRVFPNIKHLITSVIVPATSTYHIDYYLFNTFSLNQLLPFFSQK